MKDIAIRAGKTFVQAFLAVLLAGAAGITDRNTATALLVAAVAAGLSAVQNSVLQVKRG